MKPGSIVECINDSFGQNRPDKIPVKGKLYTIIKVEDYPRGTGLFLEELPRDPFLITRFKEVLPPIELQINNLNYQTNHGI